MMTIGIVVVIVQLIFIRISKQACIYTHVNEYSRIRQNNNYYETWNTVYVNCTNINSMEMNEEEFRMMFDGGINTAKQIMYTSSNLTHLVSGMFRNFNIFGELFLNHCCIQEIGHGTFSGLSSLSELYLQENNIGNISAGIFNSLSSLTKLNLSNNNIHYIDDNAFWGANDIKIFDASLNRISNLLKIMKTFKELETLDMSDNLISNLGDNLEVVKLEIAKFNSNKIRTLNATTFSRMQNLYLLDLSSNIITSIADDTFILLKNLTTLNLRNNSITKLPLGIFRNSSRLQVLDLSMNDLSSLNMGDFTGLRSLQVLDLSFNKLTVLPKGIFHGITQLEIININNNYLKYLDIDELNLIHVTDISMDFNLWCCEMLIDTITRLNNTRVHLGREYNSSNIHGIACKFCKDNDVKDPNSKGLSDTEQVEVVLRNIESWFWRSPFVDFFQRRYRDTGFFKYLENVITLQQEKRKVNKDSSLNRESLNSKFDEINTSTPRNNIHSSFYSTAKSSLKQMNRLENINKEVMSVPSSIENSPLTGVNQKTESSNQTLLTMILVCLILHLVVMLTFCVQKYLMMQYVMSNRYSKDINMIEIS